MLYFCDQNVAVTWHLAMQNPKLRDCESIRDKYVLCSLEKNRCGGAHEHADAWHEEHRSYLIT